MAIISFGCYEYYTRLIFFWVLQVRGAHLRGFAPGSTLQSCSGCECVCVCVFYPAPFVKWEPSISKQKIEETINITINYLERCKWVDNPN